MKETHIAKIPEGKELPYFPPFPREDDGHAPQIDTALKILYGECTVLPRQIVDLGCGVALRDIKDQEGNNMLIERCDIYDTKLPNLKVTDLNSTFPYDENSFDWIFGIEILEHLENPWHFFRECKRIGLNGSIIFFSTPLLNSPRQRVKFYDEGAFHFFGDTESLKYRKGFKHITPVFEWQLAQIFQSLDIVPLHRIVVDTDMAGGEILIMEAKIFKK